MVVVVEVREFVVVGDRVGGVGTGGADVDEHLLQGDDGEKGFWSSSTIR